jgi:Pretoxin HINT domain
VFNAADADGDGRLEVRATGDVIGRVIETFVNHSDVVIDLVVSSAGGEQRITGTPGHPFWVPAVGEYVSLGALEPETVLWTPGGGEARVQSLTWRRGDFETFNFHVEGVHNYYVQGPDGGGDAVLVHNTSLPDDALVCRGGTCTADRFATGSGVTIDEAGNLQGVSVNSAPGASLEDLTKTIPNKQVGVTTVGDVRAAGGKVVSSPTPSNPTHATMSGITPKKAEELFTPTVPNPNR